MAAPDFDEAFQILTPILLDHGWLLPPKMLGGELEALWNICEPFRSDAPRDGEERREAERKINSILVFYASHPNYRAYFVWLAQQQPYVSNFSHLIETGVLHYYRQDYLSCILCLLPAVEGVLRAHRTAYSSPRAVLSGVELTEFLREQRPLRSYPDRHAMYRNALADFFSRWLWKRTDHADWDLSYLNRHYVLHGVGHEHYYRSADCHRLFLFLDLYMEMLVLETGIGEYVFVPDHIPAIHRRARYYELRMIWGEELHVFSRRATFLREHPNFKEEEAREGFIERLERWAKIMGLDRPRRMQDDRGRRRAG